MHLIAHRGNISGPNPKRENTPEYIEEAIEKGFDVVYWVTIKGIPRCLINGYYVTSISYGYTVKTLPHYMHYMEVL